MADRIENWHIVCSAGTIPPNFQIDGTTFDPGLVTAITIHIPGGHAGLTGIQIGHAQQQIIPSPPRIYYRGNKRTHRVELSELFPASGSWEAQTINLGRHDHGFEIEFEVDALVSGALLLPPVLLLPSQDAVAV